MKQQQLDKFRVWFDDYVAGFYGDDEFVNVNIKLKEDHSRRTCKEMLYLAEQLNLSANQRLIQNLQRPQKHEPFSARIKNPPPGKNPRWH